MLPSLDCKGCSRWGNVTIRILVIRIGDKWSPLLMEPNGYPEAEQDRGMRRAITVSMKELVDLRVLKDLICPYNSPEWH